MIVGSVIALLGVGLLITLFFLGGGPTVTGQVSIQDEGVNPHGNYSEVVSPSSSVAGSIALAWSASGPANVTFTAAVPCHYSAGYCPSGAPVLSWTQNDSGKGTDASVHSSVYILEVTNPGDGLLTFSALVTVTFNAPPPIPPWGWGLIAGGGVVLLGIGGVATFLGLFLPAGVYSRKDAGTPLRPPLDRPPDEPPP